MSDVVGEVRYKLVPDPDRQAARRAGDQIAGDVESGLESRTPMMRRIGGGFMLALGAGAIAAGGAGWLASNVIGSASDLEETRSKVQQIFGGAAGDLRAWAEGAAEAFGQSERQALDAASTFAIFGSAAGLSGSDLVGFSSGLTELASDLASFNNTSPEQAIEAIGAALRGESEPIRAYGVMLDDATLKMHAMELGIYDGNGALTTQQKVLAAQAAIMAQTSTQQGDFARTSDGLANKQRILSARFEDVKAKLGGALLPVALQVTDAMGSAFTALQPHLERFAEWLGEVLPPFMERVRELAVQVFGWLRENVPPILDRIGEIAAVVFPILVEVFETVAAKVREVWPQVQEIISGVLEAVGATIEAFVDVVEWVWRNFGDQIVDYITNAWDAVSQIISGALDTIQGVIDLFIGVLTGDWGRAWDGIKGIVSGVWQAIQGIIDQAWNVIKTIVTVALEAVGMALGNAWDAITRKVYEVWSAIAAFFDAAWEAIKRLVSSAVGAVVDTVAGAMRSMGETVFGALSTILGWFGNLPSLIVGALGDFAGLLVSKGSDLIRGMANGILAWWSYVYGWFGRLGSMILGAIGDLARILYDIGRKIITGLWDGMKAAWNGAKDWLGGLGGAIRSLKGPPEYDAVMLTGNGELIMQGLAAGMRQGWRSAVEPFLDDATGMIGATRFDVSGRVGPGGTVAGGAPRAVQITGPVTIRLEAADLGPDPRKMAEALRRELLKLEGAQA